MNAEFQLIHQHFQGSAKHADTMVGNGDDASVHRMDADDELVVSTDTAICGRHWPEDFPLDQAAERAVGTALSDLAAMGAQARWIWIAVMMRHADEAEALGRGIQHAARRYNVEVAGGDTTRAAVCCLNITVAGVVKAGKAMRRDRAEVGDDVWLLGNVGLSALALQRWLQGDREQKDIEHFSHVTPQLDAGILLSEAGVRCCIDISDGLLQDAGHICAASQCAMQIEMECLPNYTQLTDTHGHQVASKAMLAGGDDYALLFTAAATLKLPVTGAVRIGRCLEVAKDHSSNVQVIKHGVVMDMDNLHGFDHFEE